MLSVSDLSAEQIETIKSWVVDGAQMADVQKKLNEEFDFKVTYMDTRFLSLDLGLEYQVDEEPAEEEEAPSELSPEPQPQGGEVSVTLDQVARPGSMVSGGVTFSDGMKGVWMIDEMGRPSVDPDQAGYQPKEADLMAFQGQLRTLLDGQV